jgi:tetratricopeptide (TPR) repeat protein
MTLIAMILELQNRPGEARRLYEQVLDIDPTAAVAANNLAWMYAQEDTSLDAALKLAEVAAAALPDTPEVNDTLGWVYYKLQFTERAIPRFEQSVASAPDVADFRYHLGLALLANGDWDQARAELTHALEINPRFVGAEDARKALQSLGPEGQ